MNFSPRSVSPASKVQPIRMTTEMTIHLTPFDQKEYRKLIEARGETLRHTVCKLRPALGLANAVDAGCGVGFFSQVLTDCGLDACGFDGRAENVAEACNRFPQIPFAQGDVQDRAITQLGNFDLVVCFGLLYHLENPLQAIRNLRELTEKCLLVESMCLPEDRPSMLLRTEPRQGDQSLTEMACYPSEAGLVKMLYRAGFRAVYRIMPLPDHDDFRETPEHLRRRTVLLASFEPIDMAGFRFSRNQSKARIPGQESRLHGPHCRSVLPGLSPVRHGGSTSRWQRVHGEFFPECRFHCDCHLADGGWRRKAPWTTS